MQVDYGSTRQGIPFARWGTGDKSMVIFTGGPGNLIPEGIGFRFTASPFTPFSSDYTITVVSRPSGLRDGCSTRDLAAYYGDMVETDFSGYIDVVMGMSFGGMIAQHFAADFPDSFGRMVILVSAYEMSKEGIEIDRLYASLLSEGRVREAHAAITGALLPPGISRRMMRSFAWLFSGSMARSLDDLYRKDVLIEAEAEADHDVTGRLETIKNPVLMIGGGEDFYFPPDLVEETAGRIPGAQLKIYDGKSHMTVLSDKRAAGDISAFIASP